MIYFDKYQLRPAKTNEDVFRVYRRTVNIESVSVARAAQRVGCLARERSGVAHVNARDVHVTDYVAAAAPAF